jgi:hypothetical protein
VDIFELRGRVAEVALLGTTWVLAIMAPMVLLGMLPEIGNEFWILFVLAVAFFGYTGIRARRKGLTKSFFLRVMVPAVLLGVSSLVVAMSRMV